MRHDELLETLTVEFSFTHGAKRLGTGHGTGEHSRLLVRSVSHTARQAHAEASHTSTALDGRVAAHIQGFRLREVGLLGSDRTGQKERCPQDNETEIHSQDTRYHVRTL